MNRKIFFAVSVAAVLVVGGLVVSRSNAFSRIPLTGAFESVPRQALAKSEGQVWKILVKPGDRVTAGQPLVKLEAKSFQANLGGLVNGLPQAFLPSMAALPSAPQADLSKMEEIVKKDQAEYDRLKSGPSPQELKAAQDRLDKAKAQASKAPAGAKPDDTASAELALDLAQAKLKQAQQPTPPDQLANLKTSLDLAVQVEAAAKKQSDKSQSWYEQGLIARRKAEADKAAYDAASAKRVDAESAYKRASEGTPPEQLALLQQACKQAQEKLDMARRANQGRDASQMSVAVADLQLKQLQKRGSPQELQAAKSRLEQAKRILDGLRTPPGLAQANANAQAAGHQAVTVNEDVKTTVVYAPTSGIVDRILVAPGDQVKSGAALVQLSNQNDVRLHLSIPGADSAKVKPGNSVAMRVKGIVGDVRGVVEGAVGHKEGPLEIAIRLAHPDPRIKPGMLATVTDWINQTRGQAP